MFGQVKVNHQRGRRYIDIGDFLSSTFQKAKRIINQPQTLPSFPDTHEEPVARSAPIPHLPYGKDYEIWKQIAEYSSGYRELPIRNESILVEDDVQNNIQNVLSDFETSNDT